MTPIKVTPLMICYKCQGAGHRAYQYLNRHLHVGEHNLDPSHKCPKEPT